MNARTLLRTVVMSIGLSLCIVAFVYGRFLLGTAFGVAYFIVSLGLFWLLIRWPVSSSPLLLRLVFVSALWTVTALIMVKPTLISTDIHYYIEKRTIHRTALAEITKVIDSDPAASELSLTTSPINMKGTWITVSGSFPTRQELARFRRRVREECPIFDRCGLNWKIDIFNPAERIEGEDSQLSIRE